MNLNDYLMRFNGTSLKEVSFHNLAELQRLHMLHIPFENLDVIRKVPIYLNLQLIYEKIVNRNRGGYCYEVNGLFNWLLTELGYETQLIAATVQRPNGAWAKADTHAAILVHLEEPYVVDVGFGSSTYLPIPLNGQQQIDNSGTYKVNQHDNDIYDLVQINTQSEKIVYRFTTAKKELVDFHEGCVFNQVSKESSFTHYDIVSRISPSGRITLSDQTVIVTENGIQTKSTLSIEEKLHVLQKTFDIQLEEK